jgi:uncharacterized protein (TIGR03118 family)
MFKTTIRLSAIAPALAIALSANAQAGVNAYDQTNLIANDAKYNPTVMVDPYLVDAWGIALRPPGAGGHIWISNAGTGTTTTYIGDVAGNPLHQDGLKVIPIVTSVRDMYLDDKRSDAIAQVTGQVYNSASDLTGQPLEFYVEGPANNFSDGSYYGTDAGAAKFVFVTLDGTINAWRTKTDPGMQEAVVIKDYSMLDPHSAGLETTPTYTGVAMTTDAFTTDAEGNKHVDNRLYVSDFGNNRIQVFDNQWNDITASVQFERPDDLSQAYHPYNVMELSDKRIYVAYAETAFEIDNPEEELPGPGVGRIVAYDRDGHIVQDYTDHDLLNDPWGMAIAPDNWGAFGGALLVANFGDGTIAAYDVDTGDSLGYLRDADGNVISIDGIWGLTFGNGWSLGDANSLYFTAGPDEERDGIFGKLTVATAPVPEPETYAMMLAGLGLVGTMARRNKNRT